MANKKQKENNRRIRERLQKQAEDRKKAQQPMSVERLQQMLFRR